MVTKMLCFTALSAAYGDLSRDDMRTGDGYALCPAAVTQTEVSCKQANERYNGKIGPLVKSGA